jgi:hypothetical protein
LRDEAGPKVTEEAGQDNWQDEDVEDEEEDAEDENNVEEEEEEEKEDSSPSQITEARFVQI